MSIFDWVFVGLLSLTIVAGALALLMIFLWVGDRRQFRKLKVRRPKSKKRRRRWAIALKRLEKKRKRHFKTALILLVSGAACAVIAVYGRYYQATNLGEADAANIANGYNAVYIVKEKIEAVETADHEKALADLDAASKKLGSYGNKRASGLLTDDGQLMLNRYYNQMTQLGQNINSQLVQVVENNDLRAELLEDIVKIEDQQKRILTYYSISENTLKQQVEDLQKQSIQETGTAKSSQE